MREDVRFWISNCETCGANKPPQKAVLTPLCSTPVGGPSDRLATDILGPLPVSPRDHRYILVVTDYFMEWVDVFPRMTIPLTHVQE